MNPTYSSNRRQLMAITKGNGGQKHEKQTSKIEHDDCYKCFSVVNKIKFLTQKQKGEYKSTLH